MLPIALLVGMGAIVPLASGQVGFCGRRTLDVQCPEETPCCGRDQRCGDNSQCVAGCQPLWSHSVESCAPAALCQDWSTNFRDGLDRIHQGDPTDYNGNVEDYDWNLQCPERDSGRDRLETTGSGVSLVYDRAYDSPFVGVRLSSTRYIRYGTVDVVLESSRWAGVTSTFMLLSDVKHATRFDWSGENTTHVMTSSGLLDDSEHIPGGIPSPFNISGPSVEVVPVPSSGNTAAEFHKYTLDWQEDYVRWLIDDEEVRRLDRGDFDNDTNASDEDRFPMGPARVEISIKGLTTNSNVYDIGTLGHVGNPETNGLRHFTLTVQSVNVRCGGDPIENEDITGWVYLDNSTEREPRVTTTNRSVTVSAAQSVSPATGLLTGLIASLTMLAVLI